jgi:hypothetical protein
MRLLLVRKDTLPNGTDGILSMPSGLKINTLELPWNDNKSDESCIPFGIYQCKRVQSPKFGDTFEVCNVPNRSNVLFHRGNKLKDTHGCILLGIGKSIDEDRNDQLIGSTAAFNAFRFELSKVDEFELEIR